MQVPEASQPDFTQGLALMISGAKAQDDYSVEAIAVDYAKVFLAAGQAQGLAAFPYESLYSQRSRPAGAPDPQLAQLYAARGLRLRDNMFRVPEDHIGLEMQYMAVLCSEAAEKEDSAEIRGLLKEQRSFLKEHLSWCTGFCSDLLKYSETAFYRGLALATRGFLLMEEGLLETEGEIWDIV